MSESSDDSSETVLIHPSDRVFPYYPERFELVRALPRIERHLELDADDFFSGIEFSGFASNAGRAFYAALYFHDSDIVGSLSELPDSDRRHLRALYAEMDVPKEQLALAPLYLLAELDGEEAVSIQRLLDALPPGPFHEAVRRQLPDFFRVRAATHLGCIRRWEGAP